MNMNIEINIKSGVCTSWPFSEKFLHQLNILKIKKGKVDITFDFRHLSVVSIDETYTANIEKFSNIYDMSKKIHKILLDE